MLVKIDTIVEECLIILLRNKNGYKLGKFLKTSISRQVKEARSKNYMQLILCKSRGRKEE